MCTKKENSKIKNQKSKLRMPAKRADLLNFAFCILIFAFVGFAEGADLIIAEKLLVDLRADDLAYGSAATNWPNRGTLGAFTASGTPVVENVAGLKCVTFDGSSWFDGPTSIPGIEGAGTRSIEVWAYNPSLPASGEETMLSWAHRGGPDGTNMSFNYSDNSMWGAVGHWGGGTCDMGWWGSHSPAPAVNTWWHLAYTYDGTAARVYVNGVEESVRTSLTLNTYAGNIIRVGAQANNTGTGATFMFTGSIAEVRIHDGVLKPADILNNFKLGGPRKANTPSPANGAEGVITPLLQWGIGITAKYHDVYFGTNPTPGAAEFKTRTSWTIYWAGTLTSGTTYYWRVDEVEVDGVTIYPGDVWSFTAAPLTAYNPNPADGAKYVSTDVELSWTAGSTAVSHDVYFGTVEEDVANGTGSTLKSSQQKTTTFVPGPLQLGTTYYWRIDEVEQAGTKHPGNVWRFSTMPVITVTDPNLVGWWKLDEGEGATAIDWSGQSNHGTIYGDTAWVDGYDGGALKLKGIDGYVTLPIGLLINSLNSATFTTWVNFSNLGGSWQRIFDFGSGTSTYIFLCPRTGTDGPMRVAIQTGGGGESLIESPDTLPTGWHHIAVVIGSGNMQIYLDGAVVASGSTAVIPSQLGQTSSNWLGRSQYAADGYFNGTLDDFRIYNYAMSQADIPKTMRGDPLRAWNPKPADKAITDIDRALPLTWSAGEKASQHDVYFGTDQTAVANATTASTGIYRGRQAAASYNPPEGIQWGGGPYYWRIDEYNTDATISAGRVWSFTVADYLIVDDFEDYTDDVGSRIFQTWKDGWGYTQPPPGYAGNGTGSAVGNNVPPYAGQTITHDSSYQSMPLAYDNSGASGKARYSETFREWTSTQNWTRNNIKALTLWFYGDPANVAEQLYVALEDNAGHIKVVNHPDLAAVQTAAWQECNIELAQFSAAGVNLAAIKKMYIGLGNRTNPTAGGTGKIYIDDIRVYTSRPIGKPAADLSGNYIVDAADVKILANLWLDTGFQVTPADPGSTGLIAHYQFEGNANDAVGGHNGTANGMASYTTGKVGQAIFLDGVDDYVDLPIGSLIASLTNSTFATWANFSNAGGSWQRIFDFGSGETTYMFLTPRNGTTNSMRFGITTQGGGTPEQLATAPSTLASGWHHVAVTINADNDTIKLYLDGSVVAQNTQATLSPSDLGVTTQNWLGRSQYGADAYYTGAIDDFRIYSRTLPDAQIAWLAGYTSPFSIPADLHQDNVINFKDFAVLADSWLEKIWWP